MQQHAGDDAMEGLACAPRPRRTAGHDDQRQNDDRAPRAHGEKGEGIGIWRGIFCYDEAARPKQREGQRRGTDKEGGLALG
jgi:hypothetical protein